MSHPELPIPEGEARRSHEPAASIATEAGPTGPREEVDGQDRPEVWLGRLRRLDGPSSARLRSAPRYGHQDLNDEWIVERDDGGDDRGYDAGLPDRRVLRLRRHGPCLRQASQSGRRAG